MTWLQGEEYAKSSSDTANLEQLETKGANHLDNELSISLSAKATHPDQELKQRKTVTSRQWKLVPIVQFEKMLWELDVAKHRWHNCNYIFCPIHHHD